MSDGIVGVREDRAFVTRYGRVDLPIFEQQIPKVRKGRRVVADAFQGRVEVLASQIQAGHPNACDAAFVEQECSLRPRRAIDQQRR